MACMYYVITGFSTCHGLSSPDKVNPPNLALPRWLNKYKKYICRWATHMSVRYSWLHGFELQPRFDRSTECNSVCVSLSRFLFTPPYPSCPSHVAPWGHKTVSSLLTTPKAFTAKVYLSIKCLGLLASVLQLCSYFPFRARPYHHLRVIQFTLP